MGGQLLLNTVALWRNGSASDSRSEGCVFKSRQGHSLFTTNVKVDIVDNRKIKRQRKRALCIIEGRQIKRENFITMTPLAPADVNVAHLGCREC